MKCYRFYAKVDKSKETINTWEGYNKALAVQTFANRKNMTVNEFVKIFEVEKYDRS